MSGWDVVQAVCFAWLAAVSLFLACRFYKRRFWLGAAAGLGVAALDMAVSVGVVVGWL